MIDNVGIAIMTRVNELAKRYGFAPHEFAATLSEASYGAEVRILTFEALKFEDKERQEKFLAMLEQLGVSDLHMNLIATPAAMMATLDKALRLVTKPRFRS